MQACARWLGLILIVSLLLTACTDRAPRAATPAPGLTSVPGNSVVVVHWAAGELMSPTLLPAFAEQFNRAGHKTASGKPIVVQPILVNSGRQAELLTSRVSRNVALDPSVPDPVIVTPSVDHWLSQVNHDTGKTVVDLSSTQDLAVAWVGIATFREMAECLGWPAKEIGYADILALRSDPRGWASCPTARAEWGVQPLLPFSDPRSSSTARSTLFALYSIAVGKPTDQLTEADVTTPAAVEYVRRFQRGIDHYVADTLILQSKMYQGPRYGHFYFVEENTLVQLYQGKLPVTVGADIKPQPLSREMVFIYPKEGSVAHNHPAGIVQAPWVSAEQVEAARRWIEFLRQEPQQRAFMQDGFRPATGLAYTDPISSRFGLDPAKPTAVLNPINPAAAAAIMRAWDDVKKPGIVTFVVDVSGSMKGDKLEQAKQGMVRALDGISPHNRVGFITFAETVRDRVPVAPISDNRFTIRAKVDAMQATGGTALYDAIAEAILMTDRAEGEEEAIRGIVVLSDGAANRGQKRLHDIVRMTSRNEVPVPRFGGFEDESSGLEEGGRSVAKRDIIGTGLALATQHPIHIFFIGLGADADLEIGRILAEATGSAYQGATEKDLAAVLEKFGKYF